MLRTSHRLILSSFAMIVAGCETDAQFAGPAPPPPSTQPTSQLRTYDYTHKVVRRADGRIPRRLSVAILRFGDTRSVPDSPFGAESRPTASQTGQTNVNVQVGASATDAHATGSPPQMRLRDREMLKHALMQTEAFRVVERDRILDILREINFGKTSYVDPETSAPSGGLLSIRYLIEGSLGYNEDKTLKGTLPKEASYRDIGACADASDNIFERATRKRWASQFQAVMERRTRDLQRRQFDTSCYLSLYDVHTGELVKTVMGLGTNNAEAIDDAVSELMDALLQDPPATMVAAVVGDRIYLDTGIASGLREGDRLQVIHRGQAIRDTDGAVIGHDEVEAGEIEVSEVKDALCVARAVQAIGQMQRGDIVRPARH